MICSGNARRAELWDLLLRLKWHLAATATAIQEGRAERGCETRSKPAPVPVLPLAPRREAALLMKAKSDADAFNLPFNGAMLSGPQRSPRPLHEFEAQGFPAPPRTGRLCVSRPCTIAGIVEVSAEVQVPRWGGALSRHASSRVYSPVAMGRADSGKPEDSAAPGRVGY
jgi:hypothetical protein